MLVRVILGSFLAAVVFFFWGFFYWSVSPLAKIMMPKHPKEEVLVDLVREHTPTSGFYFYPGLIEGDDSAEKWMEARTRGPIGMVIVVKEGMNPADGATMGKGFVHGWVSCLLAACLLAMSAKGLPTYAARVGYVFFLGLLATVTIFGSQVIWFGHPLPYSAFSMAYYVLGFLLVGLVLAAFVKSPEPTPTV